MKVDMSPEAVTRRLKLMDELWILSMKLMGAGKRLRERSRSNGRREVETEEKKAP